MKTLAFTPALLVVFFHTAAWAQQPPPGPSYPPPPGYPPPGYPPPPPGYPPPPPPGYPPSGTPAPYPQPNQPYPPSQPYPTGPNYPPGPPQQPQPAPEPPAEPAPTPPPVYRVPPPTYYYYPPPAAHRGLYRPFTISAGLGAGVLSIPGAPRENQLGYNYLARIGFGLGPDFIVYVGVDGTGVSQPGYDVNQTNYLIGVQVFVVPRLYLRGGLGIAGVSEGSDDGGGSAAGQAFLAGMGIELVQGDSLAFALEGTWSVARFRYGAYFSSALSFSLSFF
jgi:hypothetical protein